MENKNQLPLVSIIIPAYNRAHTIKMTLDSVLNQTYKNYEVIIVDDNSKDNTYEVVKPYLSDNIFYYKNEKNLGGGKSRNVGVEHSKGSILAFLDSDDEWLPEKLEKQVNIFMTNEDIALVYTKFYLISETSGKKFVSEETKRLNDDFKSILCNNFIATTSTIAIRREAFLDINGFDDYLKTCQDWDLYIRTLKKYKVKGIEEPCVNYYYHTESITGNAENVINSHIIVNERIDKIIEENNFTPEEIKVIKSCHAERMAHIYAKFKDFKNARKYFVQALKYDKKNKKALKHLLASCLGDKIYFKLKKTK